MTYSVKFRKHVLATRENEDLTIIETSKRFNIGLASIVRWLRNVTPKKPIRPMRKINLELLRQDVEEVKDLFIKDRAKKFNVSTESMRRALLKIGFTHKKQRFFPKSK